MEFLLVESVVTLIHFCSQKRVEVFTIFFKINNALVKKFALVN